MNEATNDTTLTLTENERANLVDGLDVLMMDMSDDDERYELFASIYNKVA